MAWTDQCKIEAVNQVDRKIDNGMPVREALKAVSTESDIPVGTLKRWKYPEKSVPKNGNKKPCKKKPEDVWKNIVKRMEGILEYIDKNNVDENRSRVSMMMKVGFCFYFTGEHFAKKYEFNIQGLRESVIADILDEKGINTDR